MGTCFMNQYVYSIQPYWKEKYGDIQRRNLEGKFDISEFFDSEDTLLCVPGNGQVGLHLDDSDGLRGYFYGVLDGYGEVTMNGMKSGIKIRFTPGTFSQIFHLPSHELSPQGIPVEYILTPERIDELKFALESPERLNSVGNVICHWMEQTENVKNEWENQLAQEMVQIIWKNYGNIQIQDLSEKSGYTARYLQEIMKRQVGLSPKKLCRHIRFQRALQMLKNPQYSHLYIAQQLGYSDQAHYSREFKSYCGLSPAEYRDIYCRQDTIIANRI